MKDYQLTAHNAEEFFSLVHEELKASPALVVTTQTAGTGKWGMSRLWRSWMGATAKFMAGNGCTMPLMTKKDGTPYGSRPFNPDDAHELFTAQWLGVDAAGKRLSWRRQGNDGMRPATKGERYIAMLRHENWSSERGILLFNPRDSEYREVAKEQDS